MASKATKIPFKSGDDFALTMTVTNKTSAEALTAEGEVVQAQAAYDAENIKDEPDATLLGELLEALNDAKEAYADAIIVDITDWEITSSMRWVTRHITDFTVTKEQATIGKFVLNATNDVTAQWKPRVYDVDVQFEINGKKSSSNTFQLDVKRDVTIEAVMSDSDT